MAKKLEGAGLRGQVAGETSLCTVGQEEGLAYRGHKIETLAEKGTFEEVAYLLLYGKLPNTSELSNYKNSSIVHFILGLLNYNFIQITWSPYNILKESSFQICFMMGILMYQLFKKYRKRKSFNQYML